MNDNLHKILHANSEYAKKYSGKAKLGMPPSRKIAILTCMDARLDPAKFAGLNEGDAHVIRNAGGRATNDAIRSLVISGSVLGTKEWLVIHHSDCGMESFTDQEISKSLEEKFDTSEGNYINWFSISDREKSIKEDIERIRRNPLVSDEVNISGYLFDVKTGMLIEIYGENI